MISYKNRLAGHCIHAMLHWKLKEPHDMQDASTQVDEAGIHWRQNTSSLAVLLDGVRNAQHDIKQLRSSFCTDIKAMSTDTSTAMIALIQELLTADQNKVGSLLRSYSSINYTRDIIRPLSRSARSGLFGTESMSAIPSELSERQEGSVIEINALQNNLSGANHTGCPNAIGIDGFVNISIALHNSLAAVI